MSDEIKEHSHKLPYEWAKECLAKFFSWVIKGRKKYVTIPITLFIFLFIFLPDWRDAFTRSYQSIRELISPETSISIDELDVMNEWVIAVWSYDNEKRGEKDLITLRGAFKDYGDETLCKDIHLVRSCQALHTWILVIDYGKGPQSERHEKGGITYLRDEYNKDRNLTNNLGQLLDDCYPLYFDQKKFEYYNGKIVNIHNRNLLLKK